MTVDRRRRGGSRTRRRRLLLGHADVLVLWLCFLGLLAAWLIYSAEVFGRTPASAGAPAVRYSPAAASPATPFPEATSSVSSPAPRVPAKPPAVTAAPPERIIYPAAAMDIAVHPLKPEGTDARSKSIVPPETMDGYWLTPYGRPGSGSTNTTYVIGHSWEGMDAPFIYLSWGAVSCYVL